MVEEYFNVQQYNDLDALKKFVEYGNNDNNSNCDMYDMFFFVTTMYLNSLNPADDDDWVRIDKDKLEYLLKESFFDEYHRTESYLKRICQREYPMLDVYAFAKLQSIAVTSLPKDLTWGVNAIWTFEDFICDFSMATNNAMIGNYIYDNLVNGKDYNMLYEILTGKTLRYDLGDVNRDGNIDNEDLNMVQAHINGTSSLDDEQIHLADVSQDGNITTKDLNMIYAIIKENTFEKADINKDKVIDQKDLAALNAYLENGAELPDESLADLNGDGVVDTTDKELLEAKLNNPNYLLGDINGDKKVNADDAANAIEIFKTNSATIEKLAVGDMNYDGTINAEDAALIIEYFKTHN